MTVRLDIEPLNGEMNNIFIYYVIVKVRKAAKRNDKKVIKYEFEVLEKFLFCFIKIFASINEVRQKRRKLC